MLKNHLKHFFSNKTNIILVVVLLIILSGVGFAVNKFFEVNPDNLPIEEVDLSFDAEGPYAIIEPRRDGFAINLNIFRVAVYESINYELSYNSEGSTADPDLGPSEQGAQGTIEAKDGQNEYKQEILFGTCSKADTTVLASCVFDKNVENGALTLNIKKKYEKGDKTQIVYKMRTAWHMQRPEVVSGLISSADNHFQYQTDVSEEELELIGFTIVNDLTGAPKLPQGKTALGKVYAMNLPTAKVFPPGNVLIELIDNAPDKAQIARYNEAANSWDMLETTANGNKLTAAAPGAGIFAVLVNSQ